MEHLQGLFPGPLRKKGPGISTPGAGGVTLKASSSLWLEPSVKPLRRRVTRMKDVPYLSRSGFEPMPTLLQSGRIEFLLHLPLFPAFSGQKAFPLSPWEDRERQ